MHILSRYIFTRREMKFYSFFNMTKVTYQSPSEASSASRCFSSRSREWRCSISSYSADFFCEK